MLPCVKYTIPKEYRNLIAGKWVAADSGERFDDVNPANTNDVVGSFPLAGRNEAQQAVAAAAAAFPDWRATPAPKRGKILLKAAQILENRAEQVAQDLTREEGKTLKEARGETLRAVEILEYFGGEARRLFGDTVPSAMPNTLLFTQREPLGVVALITPWNFPIAIPAWKMAPALVCGNTVVIKPASLTPLTTLNLVQCLEEAGLPPGVLNLVTGPGSTVGDEMVNHPSVRAVSFTGSDEVGTKLYSQVSRRAVKCQCEMGGKNPIIVLEDADLEKATDFSIDGAFWSAGQKCTAASRAIVMEPILDDYTKLLVGKTERLLVGDGMEDATQVGPLVDQSQLDRVLGYIQVGIDEGARLLTGGKRLSGPKYDRGFFVSPTIFGGVTPEMRIAQEEIFGPVLSVIAVKSFDEAIEVANGIKFGLSASIVTQNLARVFQYVNRIEAGQVHVNSTTAGAECHVPFGGVKGSSTGIREQGRVAIDFYTQLKTVYLHY